MISSGNPRQTVRDLGEKGLIENILRPLFNPDNEKNSIGDDCAAVEVPAGSFAILSTDRIPADLISFRAGILRTVDLGRYLAVLNLSDVAACGGIPTALLFNCAVPPDFLVRDLVGLSVGLRDVASKFGASIVGGDISSSSEVSLSATVVGHVERELMLRRSGAKVGDTVFVTRPLGLTCVALDYCIDRPGHSWLSDDQRYKLEGQFLRLDPEIGIGRILAQSGNCTSSMDNTDGVGQTLSELARESGCAVVVQERDLVLDEIVLAAAQAAGGDPLKFAFGPGADFCLVGTLAGEWKEAEARNLHPNLQIIGRVTEGRGVFIQKQGRRDPLSFRGWNYFA